MFTDVCADVCCGVLMCNMRKDGYCLLLMCTDVYERVSYFLYVLMCAGVD